MLIKDHKQSENNSTLSGSPLTTHLGLQELGDVDDQRHRHHWQDVKYQIPGGTPDVRGSE